MILSWGQTSSPDRKFQVMIWVHMKDWIYPAESLSQPLLNCAFETILKLTHDDSATRIGVPGQKSNNHLTFFNTVLQSVKNKLLERYRPRVDVYILGLAFNATGEYEVFSNLPKWLRIIEITSNQEMLNWNLQSTPGAQSISDAQVTLKPDSELMFFLGDIPKGSLKAGFKLQQDQVTSIRMIDYLTPTKILPTSALTQWKPKIESLL